MILGGCSEIQNQDNHAQPVTTVSQGRGGSLGDARGTAQAMLHQAALLILYEPIDIRLILRAPQCPFVLNEVLPPKN